MDCRSFYNPSKYKETDIQKLDDFDFLIAQRERHTAILGQLALEIKTKAPHISSVCEIGYGLGLLMKGFSNYGCTTYGFEVNKLCHEFATNELGLPCEHGMFDLQHTKYYDAIIACMVFEHLEDPRALFSIMRERLNPDGVIYLTVPFAHRNEWPYLWTADSNPGTSPPDIFYDNDVHITHFSVEGMQRMGMSLGARESEYWTSKDIYDNSPGAYHGVLFRF